MKSNNPANPQNSGSYSQTQVDALIAAAKTKFDLLWTNPAPTETFAAQTLAIEDLETYDFLLIQCTTTGQFYHALNIFSIDELTKSTKYCAGGCAGRFTARTVKITDGGITFGDALISNGYASDATSQSPYFAIPRFIFGIKL